MSDRARERSQYVAIMSEGSEAREPSLVLISALLLMDGMYELQRTFHCCAVAGSATAGECDELFHRPRFARAPGILLLRASTNAFRLANFLVL